MTDKHTATMEDVRIKAMETQGKHLDFLALAFQQALKCDLRQIELVQQNEGDKIIWHYRKKETHDALVEALEKYKQKEDEGIIPWKWATITLKSTKETLDD